MFKKIFSFLTGNVTPQKPTFGLEVALPLGRRPEHGSSKDDAFWGEHFEGLGDAWNAILHDEAVFIERLPRFVEESKLLPGCQVRYEDGSQVLLLQYPDAGSLRAGILAVRTPENEKMEIWSSFPILEGLSNSLRITSTHTWSNNVEGVVAARKENDGPPITYFDPFYFRDFEKLAPGAQLDISLAALALKIEPAELQEFALDKGQLYEMRLKEFLDKYPDKSEAEFAPPVVSMRGARILLPAQYVSEWEFRCPILTVGKEYFNDILYYKMSVCFVGMDDEELVGYLYATEKILGGYIPEVGHDIQGILWMTGSIAHLAEENV